jgi:hypothetical protein
VAACAALLLLELAPRSVPWVPLPREEDLPPVYARLAGRDDVTAILELPWRDPDTEVLYMYYGTRHWKPLVNGYSGYFPRQYLALRELSGPTPTPALLQQLRLLEVSHLVVHWNKLRQPWKRAVFHRLVADGEIALVRPSGHLRVFRILPRE